MAEFQPVFAFLWKQNNNIFVRFELNQNVAFHPSLADAGHVTDAWEERTE